MEFGFAVVVFVLWALYLLYKLLVWGYSVVDMVPCQLEVGYYLLGLGLDGVVELSRQMSLVSGLSREANASTW